MYDQVAGHGTHVAGTAAGLDLSTTPSSTSVQGKGVAYEVQWHGVRSVWRIRFGRGSGSDTRLVRRWDLRKHVHLNAHLHTHVRNVVLGFPLL